MQLAFRVIPIKIKKIFFECRTHCCSSLSICVSLACLVSTTYRDNRLNFLTYFNEESFSTISFFSAIKNSCDKSSKRKTFLFQTRFDTIAIIKSCRISFIQQNYPYRVISVILVNFMKRTNSMRISLL